jgi:hypothetical protein
VIDASPAIEAQDKVSYQLVELGWARLDPASPNPLLRYALYLPGDREILPATWLMPRIDEHDAQDRIGVAALVGFECPAARDVTTALLGRAYSGAVLRRPQKSAGLTGGGEAAEAIEALVEFVVTQQPTLSSTDAERVIQLLEQGEALPATNPSVALETTVPPPQRESTEVATAMLAALGRYGEARSMLDSLSPITGSEHPLQTRFVHQLGRWIDAAGSLPLPTSPAQWGPSQSEGPSDGPRDFPETQQPPLGAAHTAVRGIRGIIDFVKDAGSREGPLASVLATDSEQREVAEVPLPARATYPVASLGERSVVGIDPSAAQRLQNDLMRGRREMDVRIWFDVEDESTVAAHIGPHRVAGLSGGAAQSLAAPIAAAAERGELPWTKAALSDGPNGLRLHLALPRSPG